LIVGEDALKVTPFSARIKSTAGDF
jgi:hypothetical protein